MSQKTSFTKKALHSSACALYLLPFILGSVSCPPLLAEDSKSPTEALEESATYTPVQRANIAQIEIHIKDQEDSQKVQDARKKVIKLMETKEGLPYFPHQIDKDIKKIAQTFEVLSSSLQETDNGYKLSLTLREREKIASIHWHGNKKLLSKNFTDLNISEGDLYSQSAILSAKRKVLEHYHNKGYRSTAVTYELLPSAKPGQLELHFHIEEGSLSNIQLVQFTGLDRKEVQEVSKLLLTREQTLINYLFYRAGMLVEEWLEHDVLAITRWLQSRGYVDASAAPNIEKTKKGVEVTFAIEKGSQYLVGDLSVNLSESDYIFSSDKEVAQLCGLESRSPYSPEALHSASEKLARFLGSKGYTSARVLVSPRFSGEDEHTVSLDIQVISGEKSYVGMVQFSGNNISKPRVILHELLLTPGEVLNTRALEASERRLLNTSLFSRVHISTREARDPLNNLKDYKDIVVDLEEKQGIGKFAFSLGANTKSLGYINFEVAEPNFNSRGFSRLAKDGLPALRGNGEYISANLQIAQRSLLHDIKWTYPYIFESPWTFSLRLDKGNHRDQTSYDRNQQGLTFHFFHSPAKRMQFSLYSSLRYDTVNVRSPESSAVTAVIIDQEQFNGPKLSVGTALNLQTIDHFIFPTKGVRSRTDFSLTRILNKEITYGKASQETSCYFPLLKNLTLKLRGDLHAVLPFGSTTSSGMPISSKMLLGSDNCMRGFANQSIGASYIDQHPLGGLTLGFASAELLYKIFPDLGLFVFSDNGVISEGKLSFDRPYYSMGFGLRVNIAGQFPLSLGMGYPLRVDHESQRSNFIFEVGGHY